MVTISKVDIFNRENDINYIGEGIGYTQGLGITYSVDFDNLKEFIQNIFPKKKQQTDNSSNSDDLPDSEFSPEYINFINDRKHKKSSDLNENEQQRIPEIE
ncbi:MAG: hypothetical protein KYX68_09675 [Flavobacterium sp.]|nr:hypothetical protein [Flavobacterium sp.]